MDITFSAFANSKNNIKNLETKTQIIKIESKKNNPNYFEVIYEVVLMSDGCFHLLSYWEDGTIIVNGPNTYAGRTVFGCIENFDEFC